MIEQQTNDNMKEDSYTLRTYKHCSSETYFKYKVDNEPLYVSFPVDGCKYGPFSRIFDQYFD